MSEKGLKHDSGKQPWFALPLEVLEPLADVFAAGEKKYSTFNCLQPFDNASRRFYDATMRHLTACQIDPLAKDEETGCYHAAQAVFSILMRLHHAKKEAAIAANPEAKQEGQVKAQEAQVSSLIDKESRQRI